MRQYWIRLVFEDSRRRVGHFVITNASEPNTIEAARAGRIVERVNLWPDDQAAIDSAKRWLRLHRKVMNGEPGFDCWVVIGSSPTTGLPVVIAVGGLDDE